MYEVDTHPMQYMLSVLKHTLTGADPGFYKGGFFYNKRAQNFRSHTHIYVDHAHFRSQTACSRL